MIQTHFIYKYIVVSTLSIYNKLLFHTSTHVWCHL